MTQETDVVKYANIPSVIVSGRMHSTQEEREVVNALSHEDLMRTLDYYLNRGTVGYNGFGCQRLMEDFALEQVGDVARQRGDLEILARVSTRYRELAIATKDEDSKTDFLEAASFYEITK